MIPAEASDSAPAPNAKQDNPPPHRRGGRSVWLERFAIFGGGLLVGGVCTAAAIFHIFFQRAWQDHDGPGTPDLEISSSEIAPPSSSAGPLRIVNEDIRSVLQRLAKEAGTEIMISDLVQGTVNFATGDGQEVSPRQALEIIVQAKGLILNEGKNMLFVKTQSEMAKEPTEGESYRFRNAKAAEPSKLLARMLRSGIEPAVDERTNTVFYRENRSHCEAIHEFLQMIDEPIDPK